MWYLLGLAILVVLMIILGFNIPTKTLQRPSSQPPILYPPNITYNQDWIITLGNNNNQTVTATIALNNMEGQTLYANTRDIKGLETSTINLFDLYKEDVLEYVTDYQLIVEYQASGIDNSDPVYFTFATPIEDLILNNLTISQNDYLFTPFDQWVVVTQEEMENVSNAVGYTTFTGNITDEFTIEGGADSLAFNYQTSTFNFSPSQYVYGLVIIPLDRLFSMQYIFAPVDSVEITTGLPYLPYIQTYESQHFVPGTRNYLILKGSNINTGSGISKVVFWNFLSGAFYGTVPTPVNVSGIDNFYPNEEIILAPGGDAKLMTIGFYSTPYVQWVN